MSTKDKLIELIQDAVGGCARNWAEIIADHLIANGGTVQRWIPVSERLPEEREGWGYTSSDLVIVAGKRHDGSLYVSKDTTTNGEWNTTQPLYWMPLPEPPKGDNDEV